MVYQLIYISSVASGVSDSTLRDIAKLSQRNNRELDLTGIMLVHNGSILQVLEGDENTVETLYQKISDDARHRHCSVMVRRHSQNRDFKHLHMGFKHIQEGSDDAFIFKLTQDALEKAIPENASQEVKTLGRSFARVNAL